MDNSKVILRSIQLEDVNDLWENVYSAMTPKQIMAVKIIPSMEREKNKMGISTLISPQTAGSESAKAFLQFGFQEAWNADGWVYLAMTV